MIRRNNLAIKLKLLHTNTQITVNKMLVDKVPTLSCQT